MSAQYGADSIAPPALTKEYAAATATKNLLTEAAATGMVGHAARRILPLEDGSVAVRMTYGGAQTFTAIRGVPLEGQFTELTGPTTIAVQVSW